MLSSRQLVVNRVNLLLELIHGDLGLDLAVLLHISARERTLAVDLVALKGDAIEAATARKLGGHLHVATHQNAAKHLDQE